jgi:hypothetical protein
MAKTPARRPKAPQTRNGTSPVQERGLVAVLRQLANERRNYSELKDIFDDNIETLCRWQIQRDMALSALRDIWSPVRPAGASEALRLIEIRKMVS